MKGVHILYPVLYSTVSYLVVCDHALEFDNSYLMAGEEGVISIHLWERSQGNRGSGENGERSRISLLFFGSAILFGSSASKVAILPYKHVMDIWG